MHLGGITPAQPPRSPLMHNERGRSRCSAPMHLGGIKPPRRPCIGRQAQPDLCAWVVPLARPPRDAAIDCHTAV